MEGDFLVYEALLEDVEDEYPELVDTLKLLSKPVKSTVAKHIIATTTEKKRTTPKPTKSEKASQSRPRLK